MVTAAFEDEVIGPMRSTSTQQPAQVSARARRASDSPAAHALARAGLAARGVIYILIGWVAILVALGHSSKEADQQGALQLLAGKPYGLVSLWLLGIGFAGYSLWRLSEAAFGVTGEGNGAGPRLKSLARAVVYAGFAYLTFKIIAGSRGQPDPSAAGPDRQDHAARRGGRWLVGIAGLVIVIVGLALVVEGVRRKFMKYMQTAQMSARMRRIVERLGVIGTAARGVVFALAGVLVIEAAVGIGRRRQAGWTRRCMTLRNQPFGEYPALPRRARPGRVRHLRPLRGPVAKGLGAPPEREDGNEG